MVLWLQSAVLCREPLTAGQCWVWRWKFLPQVSSLHMDHPSTDGWTTAVSNKPSTCRFWSPFVTYLLLVEHKDNTFLNANDIQWRVKTVPLSWKELHRSHRGCYEYYIYSYVIVIVLQQCAQNNLISGSTDVADTWNKASVRFLNICVVLVDERCRCTSVSLRSSLTLYFKKASKEGIDVWEMDLATLLTVIFPVLM